MGMVGGRILRGGDGDLNLDTVSFSGGEEGRRVEVWILPLFSPPPPLVRYYNCPCN